MSQDEIATMLDELADAITERAVASYQRVPGSGGSETVFPMNGNQAVTAVVMALRGMAERVSKQ